MESTAVSLPLEETPEFLKVPTHWVFNNLKHLNKHKAPEGPDGLSSYLLKEYAELLALPVSDILNSSYVEQTLPSLWKLTDQ